MPTADQENMFAADGDIAIEALQKYCDDNNIPVPNLLVDSDEDEKGYMLLKDSH